MTPEQIDGYFRLVLVLLVYQASADTNNTVKIWNQRGMFFRIDGHSSIVAGNNKIGHWKEILVAIKIDKLVNLFNK
jgi:hypothetical protein